MRITLHLKEKATKMWNTLRNDLEMDTSELGAYLVRQEFERRQGKQIKKSNRGPGRPADSAAAKSAKFYVRNKINFLQSLKDEKRTLPNFEKAREAMQALLDAQLWERATEYLQSNWWAQGRELPEPDWQKWLEESEAE